MNDKSMAAAAVRENGAPSICVFDVNETLLDIEYIAPVFQRLFGDSNVLREWFGQLVLYSNVITLSGPYVPFFDLGQGVLRMLGAIHHVRIKDSDVEELEDPNADNAGAWRCCGWPQAAEGRGVSPGDTDELAAGRRTISATECRN